jgi:hypothetical protein
MAGLVDRMVRAAKLEPALYEEVEADTGATGQAMTVVVLSALAAGVGAWGGEGGTGAVVGTIVLALLGWFIWAGLTYILGTKLLPGPRTTSNLGELLRTIGFASSPGMLRVLGALPVVGRFIGLAAAVWMLAAFIVAVRQALDYDSTGRAVLVCVIGWIVYVGILVGLGAMLLGGAAMLGGSS